MRRLIYIILIFFSLTSCINAQTSTGKSDVNQINNIKQKFTPILKGVWVMTDYINSIEQTKSPLKSADNLRGIVTMIIDETNLSDSIEIGASWNNHEGYNFTTYFTTGQTPNCLKTNIPDYDEESNFYELGYEKINKETSLYLYHYNETNKLIDKRQFSKVAESQPDDDAAWGIQHIVNEKMFSGNYLLIDTNNTTTKINIKKDGTITGCPDFETYYIATDFLGGPKTVIDCVLFNANEKNVKFFGFQTNLDTMYFYNTVGDEDAGELLQLDKIQYRLVKQ